MAIRKTGSATGEVTGVEGLDTEKIRRTAAAEPWDNRDDQALADENNAADNPGE